MLGTLCTAQAREKRFSFRMGGNFSSRPSARKRVARTLSENSFSRRPEPRFPTSIGETKRHSDVLDGEFTVGVGEQSVIARTGSFILVPRGTVHGLRNAGTRPAKLLFVISPAGMERMFVEIAQLLSARDRPPDRAAIQAIREKYRTQDVGEMAF